MSVSETRTRDKTAVQTGPIIPAIGDWQTEIAMDLSFNGARTREKQLDRAGKREMERLKEIEGD